MPGKTEYVYLQGKAKWARLTTPDPWGNWKLTLYLTPDSYNKFIELKNEGVKNVVRKDEDGYHVILRRPTSKEIRGKVQGFAPPEVINPDGTPLRDIMIGNGSDVTVKLEVYSHKTPGGGTAKASRLNSVRVDNLIPFELSRDFEEDGDQERMVRGLPQAPPQPTW